jgi:hypothetical protein
MSLTPVTKLALIFPTLLAISCVTSRSYERDETLRQKMLGEWIVPFEDLDRQGSSFYHPDGEVTSESDEGGISCTGTWSISDGMLYVESKSKLPNCPFAPFRSVDIIEHVDEHDLILKAEDGITLHRVRPPNPVPTEPLYDTFHPKFNWPSSGNVKVRARSLKRGVHAGYTYDLVWKENGEHLQFTSRNLKYHVVNGQNVENIQSEALQKTEAAFAESKGGFRVSKQGRFVSVDNLEVEIENALKLIDPSLVQKLGQDPRFLGHVENKMHMTWLEMSGLWTVLSIENGQPVWQAASSEVLPNNFQMNGVNVEYLGKCRRAKNCVRLSMKSRKTGPEADVSVQLGLENAFGKDAKQFSITVNESMLIDIDFDTMRPFEIAKHKVTTVVKDGKSRELVEEHGMFFDWSQVFEP